MANYGVLIQNIPTSLLMMDKGPVEGMSCVRFREADVTAGQADGDTGRRFAKTGSVRETLGIPDSALVTRPDGTKGLSYDGMLYLGLSRSASNYCIRGRHNQRFQSGKDKFFDMLIPEDQELVLYYRTGPGDGETGTMDITAKQFKSIFNLTRYAKDKDAPKAPWGNRKPVGPPVLEAGQAEELYNRFGSDDGLFF